MPIAYNVYTDIWFLIISSLMLTLFTFSPVQILPSCTSSASLTTVTYYTDTNINHG